MTSDRKIAPPPKIEVLKGMEQLIHHFKLVVHGFHPPAGDVYFPIESPKGEIGCYIVSDGIQKAVPGAFSAAFFREYLGL